jgi:hypothetical protein
MPHTPTPWLGLAALIAMFVIPFLPDRLFEGPRTIRHRPQRHVCAECGAPWEAGHACSSGRGTTRRSVRGQLKRMSRSTELESYTLLPAESDDY